MTDHRHTTARQLHGCTVVTVGVELGVTTAAGLRENLFAHLRRGTHWLIVDLNHVNHCDAFGLAVLLSMDRRARLSGGGLRLAAPTVAAMDTLRISGLRRHFAIYPTTEAAAADHDRLEHERVARA